MSAISIIICTRDRAGDLALTLESLARVQIPRDRLVELLVVDNGSKDGTAEVVKGWNPPAGMNKRYVYELQPGKGHAYNAGIREAKGDILLFTDDDVRVPENWILGMIEPIESGRADAVAGGVRLAQHLMRSWMTPKMQRQLSSTVGRGADSPWSLIGANMSFHRRVLGKVPKIDEQLGPGTPYGFAEETLFGFQLEANGFRIKTHFDVEVEHHFPVDRLRACSMLRVAWHMGKSFAYIDWHWRQRGPDSYRRDLLRAIMRAIPAAPRLLFLSFCRTEKNIQESDFRQVERLAYLFQYNRETRRAQCYEMRGSQKKTQ